MIKTKINTTFNKIKNIASHQGFRKYFFNTSWLFAEQILRMIAGLLVGVWVARYLGPEQLGVFSYAIAFTAIFGGISKLGLDGIVVRELVKNPDNLDIYLGTAFWLKLFGAFVTLGLVVVTTFFTSNDQLTNLYIYIIASGMIFQSFEVVDFYFQAKVLARFVSICKMVQLFLSSLLKVYFVVSGKPLFWFVVVSLIDQIALAISYYIAYNMQNNRSFYGKFDIDVAKGLLKDSWPLILSSLAIMIYMRIDQIMIKEMLGSREVGLYSVAVQLSEVWYFIPMIVTSSLFPAIVCAKKVNEKLYYGRLQRLYRLMTGLAIGIALVITFTGDFFINFLYGKEYLEASVILKIYVWAGIFVFLGVASSKWYVVENLSKLSTLSTIIGAFLNIVLNFTLIQIYGMIGAAISTLISYFIAAYFMNLIYRDTRRNFKSLTMSLNLFGKRSL